MPGSQPAEVEGKTGSKSLLEGTSALRDNWSFRPQHCVTQQSHTTTRSFSQSRHPDQGPSQQRSFGIMAATQPTSGAGASQDLSSFSRPPTVSLNQPLNTQARLGASSEFGGPASGRVYEAPMTVYTKLDRSDRSGDVPSKKPDSAIGSWADSMTASSPTDERRPYSTIFNPRTAPTSLPSSRHSDESPSFPNGCGFGRSNEALTPTSTRAPSISSQRNGTYSISTTNDLAMQFGQMNMGCNSRPSTSCKSSNGYTTQVTGSGGAAYANRPATAGLGNCVDFTNDVDEVDRDGLQSLGLDGFIAPQQTNAFGDYGDSAFSSRYLSPLNGLELRNAPTLNSAGSSSRACEVPSIPRVLSEWQSYANGSTGSYNRRSPIVSDPHAYIDPRALLQIRAPYAQVYNQYALPSGLHIAGVSPYMSLLPIPLNGVDVHNGMQTREPPVGDGVQSALMYEFKSNAKSKRYELKDIYDHIAEFSGDQHGSRFIQTKLETANSDEKDRVFREIEPNAIPLMTDVFGNYVIQKFFEHGDQTHKKILANKMRGQMLNLSLQMYGCRVVQKALDHVLVDQQAMLISELESHVIKCVKDQNGNHVIQKAIERCPSNTIGFIIDSFRGQVQQLSIHPYGCRVIQRCLERCDTPSKATIMAELIEGIPTMIPDTYGNYVVQHIVARDEGAGRLRVLQVVLSQLENFSKHKFASNVVEKCLEQADDHWRRRVVYALMDGNQRHIEGEGVLVSMIKDNFGNYVIRKSWLPLL